MTGAPGSPHGKDVFDLLSVVTDRHCCGVLRYFCERDREVVAIDELGAAVRRENDGAEATSRVERRLHHVVLPRLADAGLIEYDARSGTVRYRGRPPDGDPSPSTARDSVRENDER